MNNGVLENQGLVYMIVKKYAPVKSADFEDYYQEGLIALDIAIESYNKNKGTKFSSYASKVIKNAILRYICNNKRNVRIPENFYTDNAKIYKFEIEYRLQKGRVPTIEEMSKHTGLSQKRIKKIRSIFDNPEFSLYTKLRGKDDNQDAEFLDIYADNNYQNPEQELLIKSKREVCRSLLASLDIEKRAVLIDRYGFNGKKLTYKEIGEKHGFSKQRSQQIEVAALKKLRTIAEKHNLKVYI